MCRFALTPIAMYGHYPSVSIWVKVQLGGKICVLIMNPGSWDMLWSHSPGLFPLNLVFKNSLCYEKACWSTPANPVSLWGVLGPRGVSGNLVSNVSIILPNALRCLCVHVVFIIINEMWLPMGSGPASGFWSARKTRLTTYPPLRNFVSGSLPARDMSSWPPPRSHDLF